jgi:hypothetical protein
MPRLLRLFALLAALALLVAGCGGGDDDDKDASTAAQGAASGATAAAEGAAPADAGAVLAAAKVDASGPVRTALTLKATFEGRPTDPTVEAFLGTPLEVRLDGAADGATRKADVDLQLKAGAFNVNAKLLSDGTTTWLGLSDAFYELPADATGGGTPPTVDPAALTSALGNPADYLQDPELVGSEEIEGIATQHVRGTIDVARLAEGLQGLASAASSGIGGALSGSTTAAEPVDAAALQQAIKSATLDAWVADDTSNIVRLLVDVDVEIPEDQQAGTAGISGARLQLEATNLPTDPVEVEAPADVRPAEELQAALLGLLAGGLGGGGSSGLGDALGG